METYRVVFAMLVKKLQACGLIQDKNIISDASLIEADASINSMVDREEGDPDATLVSKKTQYNKLCYKVHYSIDAKSRVITDCFTTTGTRRNVLLFLTEFPTNWSNLILEQRSGLQIENMDIEGLFGEAKENHSLRRVKYRGIQKVQI